MIVRMAVVVKTNGISHFGIGAPPILVYFGGDWDVHWGYDLGFHPWPYDCHMQHVPDTFVEAFALSIPAWRFPDSTLLTWHYFLLVQAHVMPGPASTKFIDLFTYFVGLIGLAAHAIQRTVDFQVHA